MNFWIYFLSGFIFTAFGQPAWIPGFGIIAGALGFALFWRSMCFLPRSKDRFFLALFFYFCVHAVQLSWMTSSEYMGPLIYVVYGILLLGVGAQFGLLSLLIRPAESLSLLHSLGIAGCWVWLEWIRIYFLSGFTWNPAGLAMADSSFSLQWASLFGIYGLSFWVIFVNLTALQAFFLERSKKNILIWGCLAFLPYGFGFAYQIWNQEKMKESKILKVALLQTGLLPEQKDFWRSRPHSFIPPLDQWDRVFHLLKNERNLDLIVLPEAAFPYGAYRTFYPLSLVKYFWIQHFGTKGLDDFPSLQMPYATLGLERGEEEWKVSNLFLAQALANHYNSSLIVGLDAHDLATDCKYNAAFHFQPHEQNIERYEKRVLVPAGEYVPFKNWKFLSEFLTKEFGIGDSFDAGTEVKLFHGPLPIGIEICLEEIYSGLIRDLRKSGALLLVNISNDVWFPNSRLAEQHFQHGRIRAVENGISLLRSCNTGVTAGVDCFGRTFSRLPAKDDASDVLVFSFPVCHFQTLYTWWGDRAILGISLVSLLFLLRERKKKLL